MSNTRHESAQHISVITRQPGSIREVHQLGSRKQPEVFEGAESSRGVWDLRITTLMAVRQTTLRLNHLRIRSTNLAYRKLKIILWKMIKIEPVATAHWFSEQERSAASTAARGQFGDSGSDMKKNPPRTYYPRVNPNGRNRAPELTD